VDNHHINNQLNRRVVKEKEEKILHKCVKCNKKIVMIGDSHLRGIASELQDQLGREYSISRTILPGACLRDITKLAKNELTNITLKDTIVIWGGANDIYRNEAKSGFRCLHNFIKQRTNSNILTLTIPHRYDLSPLSCVNNEIHSYNRKVHKMAKNISRVKIVDYDLTRGDYTRHGLHINARGKSKVANKIAQILTQHLVQDEEMIMPLHWTDQTTNPTQGKKKIAVPKDDNVQLSDRQENESYTAVSEEDMMQQNDSQKSGKEERRSKLLFSTTPSKSIQWTLETTAHEECGSATHTTNEGSIYYGCCDQTLKEDSSDIQPLQKHNEQRISNRRKMTPLNRTNDFLWE
jgi:lysophospholipase L1-like esterase